MTVTILNNLLLNAEAKEMVIDFSKKGTTPRPLHILDRNVELVDEYA